MARYTYNAGLVTQTIDTLYDSCDTLDSTNVDIKKGISTILNARGAENINIDFSPILGYYDSVIEYVDMLAGELKKKAQEIEEYQNAPWWKKLFATIGMGALKLIEGLATFVEQIGDGLVAIVGFIGGIFSSDFRDCLGEFIKTDWVGDTTAKWYEEGWLQGVNKYSIMSHESTAANVLKGVGVAAGYVILSVVTAGAGTAVSLGVSTAAAAAGGIGSGTQSGLQAGKTFNEAFGQGVKEGAVAAATTLVAHGVGKALSGAKMTANGVQIFDDVVTNADDIANLSKVGKLANSAKGLINTGAQKFMSNGAGRLLIEGVQTVDDLAVGGTNIGRSLINASGSIAGASSSGQFDHIQQSSDYRIEQTKDPSVAEQFVEDTNDIWTDEETKPGVATEEEAKQNLQDLKDQGYNPGSGSPEVTTPETTTPETPTNTGQDNNGGTTPATGDKPTVKVDDVKLPDYPTQDPTPGNDQTPTDNVITTPDDIVGKVDPIPGGDDTTPTGGISTITTIDEETSKSVNSDEVLNTFGDVSGSFAELSGSKANVPTSSSPLLSSDDTKDSKSFMAPLGAGLTAATAAGFGTKALIDRQEKKKSEEEDIDAEEWSDQNDMEIDYGLDTSEDADYLSPTDELAFQE